MTKPRIDDQALVRMGKGRLARLKPITCGPWYGAMVPSKPVFNAAQVEENRRLYPHLFRGDR